MQVFLPYSDLQKSVSCLDPSRLGNQVYRECLTLIRGNWPNHPVSKMWRDYKYALAKYAIYGLEELTKRGRHYPKWYDYFNNCLEIYPNNGLPSFIGNEQFHSTHRQALLYKKFDYYSQFNWTESPKLEYVWPIK